MWYHPRESVFIYQTEATRPCSGHLAIFDLSRTLTDHAQPGLMPRRQAMLEYLLGQGYELVIVTNQSLKDFSHIKERIETFHQDCQLPMTVYVSNGIDDYRKPNPAMWELIATCFEVKSAFMVGNSTKDQGWAANLDLPFEFAQTYFLDE